MFIQLKVLSKDQVTNKDRKKYIEKLYPEEATFTSEKRKLGIITKFNNAIGFKEVTRIFDNYDISKVNEIQNPEDYLTPSELLFKELKVCFNNNELFAFVIEDKTFNHEYEKFSYKTKYLISKLSNFLQKVFPNTLCEIEYLDCKPKLTMKEFILQEFFICIKNSPYYTIEVSTKGLLLKQEKEEILEILQDISALNLDIDQYYCETCVEHSNNKYPYHTEIVYK